MNQQPTTNNQQQITKMQFADRGYELEKPLGENKLGGRVTYLARHIPTETPVALKQFQFAKLGTTWLDYEAHEREIEILQGLNHPQIPKYLDSFETEDGFCLVQEYKPAHPLAIAFPIPPQEVQKIALSILDVLVYLQAQKPPIFHRDIKPENLLIDPQNPTRVYLVDFGFARPDREDINAHSTIKGTLGFMAPEQILNRPPSKASDLYSLGVTLICLLTGTRSSRVNTLFDRHNRLNLKSLLPQVHPRFLRWLEKMTATSPSDRYADAKTALAKLQAIASKPAFNLAIPRFLQPGLTLTTGGVVMGILASILARPPVVPIAPTEMPPAIGLSQPKNPKPIGKIYECPGCNWSGADLRSKDLRNANLRGANLTKADLRGADLKNADLSHADLRGANLKSADLTGANVTGANFKGAKFN
ncbi:MAG: pentapeptide repeat-containing protein [Spirulina sp.]